MTKGTETRQTILDLAMRMASTVGLEALSIGELSKQLHLSKSGLFAHFRSKENLQIEVIRSAAERFVGVVMMPAIKEPRGEPRVRALFDLWLEWGIASTEMPGGCVFISAAAELDDRPGPVRDVLVQTQRDWIDALAQAARIAIEEGHFRADLDVDQFAFEMYSLMLGGHHSHRLLSDPKSTQRTRAAFERLLSSARSR